MSLKNARRFAPSAYGVQISAIAERKLPPAARVVSETRLRFAPSQ